MSAQSHLDTQRKVIRELWSNGTQKPSKIIKLTGYPKSTVYELVGKLRETGSLTPKTYTGRPKVLTPKKLRHLGLIVSNNKAITAGEIITKLQKKHTDLSISLRTVHRSLKDDLKYRIVHPKQAPLLTKAHIDARINWAHKHAADTWTQTIFSDETTFQMFRNTQKVWMKDGGSFPERAMPKHPYKVHAWGAFSAKGPIGFHLFTNNMDARKYCEIISEHLLPNARKAGFMWRFQQDNAPMHTAKVTKHLFETHKVRLIDWPANSPDLNPIENLWAILKRKVEKRVNLKLAEKKGLDSVQFQQIIQQEWNDIDFNLFLTLSKSMPKRICELIAKDGQKINF